MRSLAGSFGSAFCTQNLDVTGAVMCKEHEGICEYTVVVRAYLFYS